MLIHPLSLSLLSHVPALSGALPPPDDTFTQFYQFLCDLPAYDKPDDRVVRELTEEYTFVTRTVRMRYNRERYETALFDLETARLALQTASQDYDSRSSDHNAQRRDEAQTVLEKARRVTSSYARRAIAHAADSTCYLNPLFTLC